LILQVRTEAVEESHLDREVAGGRLGTYFHSRWTNPEMRAHQNTREPPTKRRKTPRGWGSGDGAPEHAKSPGQGAGAGVA
jgi:hypothetical protein